MKYMGSKRRIVKDILPIMLREMEEDSTWVEPFVGGGNVIEMVPKQYKRIGSDSNKYLIALFKELQSGEFTPPFICENLYKDIRLNRNSYPDWIIGYAGVCLSFGAKWWGGYRRDVAGVRDYNNEAQQNLRAQQNLILGVEFFHCIYDDLNIPSKSVIYCDPPYRNTTKYKDQIDYEHFYDWCREQRNLGNKVFVSEYDMPTDFECIWQKEITSSLTKDTGSKKGTEKLFGLF